MSSRAIFLDAAPTLSLQERHVVAKRRGGKPKGGGGVKDDEIRLRVTAEEKAAFQAAAAADSRSLSDWVRLTIRRAAGVSSEK